MAWAKVEKAAFMDALLGLPAELGEIAQSLYLPIIEQDDFPVSAVIRDAAHDPTDQPPPGHSLYLIHGDLTLSEAIYLSRLNEEGADGNMVFVVTGNLACPRFVSEWGAVVMIGGDLTITELMFVAREDSAHFVLGDIDIWGFIGWDIWLEYEDGRSVDIEYGFGYTLRRQRVNGVSPSDAIRPRHSEAESLAAFGLADRRAIFDLDMRLYSEDVPSLR